MGRIQLAMSWTSFFLSIRFNVNNKRCDDKETGAMAGLFAFHH